METLFNALLGLGIIVVVGYPFGRNWLQQRQTAATWKAVADKLGMRLEYSQGRPSIVGAMNKVPVEISSIAGPYTDRGQRWVCHIKAVLPSHMPNFNIAPKSERPAMGMKRVETGDAQFDETLTILSYTGSRSSLTAAQRSAVLGLFRDFEVVTFSSREVVVNLGGARQPAQRMIEATRRFVRAAAVFYD